MVFDDLRWRMYDHLDVYIMGKIQGVVQPCMPSSESTDLVRMSGRSSLRHFTSCIQYTYFAGERG